MSPKSPDAPQLHTKSWNIEESERTMETEPRVKAADSETPPTKTNTSEAADRAAGEKANALDQDTEKGKDDVKPTEHLQTPGPDDWHSGALTDHDEPEFTDASNEMQDLSISAATLKPPQQESPSKELPATPPIPPSESEKPYYDPTPRTPQFSRPVSRMVSDSGEYNEKAPQPVSEPTSDVELDRQRPSDQEAVEEKESQPEIQSIMEQFTGEGDTPGQQEIMSPRMDLAGPMLGVGQFPPRRSSLEPLRPPASEADEADPDSPSAPPVPPKSPPTNLMSPKFQKSPMTPASPAGQSAPPLPEPEPELPFDFHRFLEQLRHKSADPVAKFLRSFLTEFGKKQWMVHEQVKIISDFLAFITNKMALCDIWRDVSDTEFDNAKEGMEKLVMNRLYTQTFSPAISPAPPPPRSRSKRKDGDKLSGPGRRGQHQEDVERDDILAQKIRIYGWVREEHLDIPSVGPGGKRFLSLAQQELLKIKGYRAPRDKVICVLNCCKVIFGLLKNAKSKDTSADSFVPLLIYVVLQANPEHLVSNIQYILRFRNQDKLGGEAGYYLSSLSGAIQFIETLDRTTLTVSDDEFERNVEIAVSAIAEQNREAEASAISPASGYPYFNEKSTLSGPEVTPRTSMDAEYSGSNVSPQRRIQGHQPSLSADSSEDNAAVAGLLRTIQRPLSTIGRIFSDDPNPSRVASQPASTPQPGATPRLSPAIFQPPRDSLEGEPSAETGGPNGKAAKRYGAEEAAARQSSAEAAEAQRIQRKEHKNVVETLYGMFPNLDRDVIDDVVRVKEGRVGLAVDACLALSAGS